MSTYADHHAALLARGFVATMIPGGMFGSQAYTCTACGSLVMDLDRHEAWHRPQSRDDYADNNPGANP